MSYDAARDALPQSFSLQHHTRTVAVEQPALFAQTFLSDSELIAGIQERDCDALSVLFDRYARLVFTISFRIVKNYSEAEDLVQEIFLHIYENCKRFDPEKGAGRTWIVQIAYCRAFDRRAYLNRRSFYAGTNIADHENTLKEAVSFEDRISAYVTGTKIRQSFEELNEKQRVTLELYFFEGYTLREIADRIGETLENTRHFYYRGMERLNKTATSAALR
jgi:RNA polymerase sigma-70 factor (ECF subfamily)